MNSIKEVGLPEFGGADQESPTIPLEEYRSRIGAATERLRQAEMEFLVIYGDREHFANLAYLTGMDPRFEEALLLLNTAGETVLLVGNECLAICRKRARLPGGAFSGFQPARSARNSSRPLKRVLSDFGIRPGAESAASGGSIMRTTWSRGMKLPPTCPLT
jgi:hypothetical protein